MIQIQKSYRTDGPDDGLLLRLRLCQRRLLVSLLVWLRQRRQLLCLSIGTNIFFVRACSNRSCRNHFDRRYGIFVVCGVGLLCVFVCFCFKFYVTMILEMKNEIIYFCFLVSRVSWTDNKSLESVSHGCSRFFRQRLRIRKTNYSEGTVYDHPFSRCVSVKHKFRRMNRPSEGTNDKTK